MSAPDTIAPFLLFAGEAYYAAPSWDEFRCAYLTQEDASRAAHEGRITRRTDRDWICVEDDTRSERSDERIDWYQIVDLRTLTVVEQGGSGYGGIEREWAVPFKQLILQGSQS